LSEDDDGQGTGLFDKSRAASSLMSLSLGAKGWDHPDWSGDFYPDDLPQDWQLAYYCNEYNAVLVPANAWQQADSAALSLWRDEAADSFRFFLEISVQQCRDLEAAAAGLATILQTAARELCAGGGGVCIVAESDTAADKPSCVQSVRNCVGDELPVHILLPDDALTAAIKAQYQVYADIQQHIVLLANGQGKKCDLRHLRDLIETIHSDVEETVDIVVFFDGTPPAVDDMQNTRIIADLLGLPC